MKPVILLAEAVEDLEQAREFYDKREESVGDYCVTSLLADVSSLSIFHGFHSQHLGCLRLLATRFPFGIYYVESVNEIRVIAVLDLRRHPSWIRKQIRKRQ
jgi:hypothetical protein